MKHIEMSHELLDIIAQKKLRRVLIESPLASPTIEGWVKNKKYAKECLRDSISRGESPYASHVFFAQEGLIDDDIPEERAIGIHIGLLWGTQAEITVVYQDLGISSGMQKGIDRANLEGRPIEYRTLGYIPEILDVEIEFERKRRELNKILQNNLTDLNINHLFNNHK